MDDLGCRRVPRGQQIAVPILLPMAVAVLVDHPFAEGDYYPGDAGVVWLAEGKKG